VTSLLVGASAASKPARFPDLEKVPSFILRKSFTYFYITIFLGIFPETACVNRHNMADSIKLANNHAKCKILVGFCTIA